MIWCIKTYVIAYVKTQKIRYIIHYVKPTAQLLFKIRFPKDGWVNRFLPSGHIGANHVLYDSLNLTAPMHDGN